MDILHIVLTSDELSWKIGRVPRYGKPTGVDFCGNKALIWYENTKNIVDQYVSKDSGR